MKSKQNLKEKRALRIAAPFFVLGAGARTKLRTKLREVETKPMGVGGAMVAWPSVEATV